MIKDLLAEHGRQFATIRTEVQPNPSGCSGHYLRGERRPQGQSRQDHICRQQEHQHAHSARCDEEPEADRNSALHLPGKPFLPRPTTPPSWKKTPSGCARNIRTVGYFKVLVQDPKTEIHDTGPLRVSHSRCCRRGRARPSISPCRSRKANAIGWPISRSRTTRQSPTPRHLRSLFPIKDGDIFSREKSRQGPGKPAQCVSRVTATSTSLRCRTRTLTTRRN